MPNDHNEKVPSLGMKWLLLICSLAVLALMLGTAKSAMFSEWRRHQREYRDLLIAKARDNASRQSAREFKIELQQVVVPELGTTDRCVSCHTGIDDPRMAHDKQPYRTHPGRFLTDHPISKYGCTICHRGQGRATTMEDARAIHAFWDYPMLPEKLTQASCGQCHDPSALKGRGGDVLARGAELFESRGCRSCHKLGGRGGSLGIALDDEGRRVIHQLVLTVLKGEHTVWNWLESHFRDPQGIVAGSQMRYPGLTEPEIEALTTYTLSLSTATLPNEYIAPDKIVQKYSAIRPTTPDGKRMYKQFCFACHETGTYTRWDKTFKRFIPAIRGNGLAASPPDYLKQQIRLGREGTQMAGWQQQAGGLSEAEIRALDTYIRAGRKPVTAVNARISGGDPKQGKDLFGQNCRGCHGTGGKGGIAPVIADVTFQKASSDAFILATIRDGRPDTAMPSFQRARTAGLTNAELADLLAYIRTMK
ncbi:MAG: c-type cytochrome [Armatimonadota bacterium]